MIFKFKGHEIELYDSIQNLPILRFQKFNKYQLMNSDIGNTFEDYDARLSKVLAFLGKGMTLEAIQELENQRQTVYNAYNEFSPILKAFAVMVKRVDEKEYTTYAPDDLQRILEHLNDIGYDIETSFKHLREVKKKVETELQVYFPNFFQKGNDNMTALRIKRAHKRLEGVLGANNQKEVYEVEKEILIGDKPNRWNVWIEGNMERQLEVDFHKYLIAVSEHTAIDIKETTTFTFYSIVEHLQEKKKP